MEWDQKLQAIIDYIIEEQLQKTEIPIDKEKIANIAGCSFDFFQKTFSYFNNISFSEYVRNRKLTLAGYDLKSSPIKVVDLSFKYGYNSPTSFTKAFKSFHGVSPLLAKKPEVQLKVYPKMQVTQRDKYAWNLLKKESFRLVGKSIKIEMKSSAQTEIPRFWNSCQRDGTFLKLISLDERSAKGLFGVINYVEEESEGFEYSIMCVSNAEVEEGYEEMIIPSEMWAVFNCLGPVPNSIQRGWKYLNEEWVVKYPFKHSIALDMEWYSSGNPFAEEYLSQIWIPIKEEI